MAKITREKIYKEETFSVSLNDYVYFKLTDVGRNIYEKYIEECKLKFGGAVDDHEFYQYDSETGLQYMQLHRFMVIFGKYLYKGVPIITELNRLTFKTETAVFIAVPKELKIQKLSPRYIVKDNDPKLQTETEIGE